MGNKAEKHNEDTILYDLHNKTEYNSKEPNIIGVDLANGKDFTSYGHIQSNLYSNEKGND